MNEGNTKTAITLALFETMRDSLPTDNKEAIREAEKLADALLASYDQNIRKNHDSIDELIGRPCGSMGGQFPAYVNQLPMPVEAIMRRIKK